MARTTNSDALAYVSSRYELGMLSSQRVRDLNGGAEPVVTIGHDKPTVTALREIASGKLDINNLRREFVQSYKSAPSTAEAEVSVESVSEDPLLREIDEELQSAQIEPVPLVAETAEEVVEDEATEEK